MKRILTLAAAAAILAVPSATSAQTVKAPMPGAEEYLDFVNANGAFMGLYGAPSKVGPYWGKFDRIAPYTVDGGSTHSFSIYCVDYLPGHNAGDTWVMSTTLGSGQSDGGLGNTRLGTSAGTLRQYRMAAYMSSLFDSWMSFVDVGQTTNYGSTAIVSGPIAKQQVWSAIHTAIWNVIYPPAPGAPGNDGLASYVTSLAATAVDINGYTADGWYVLTPETGQGTGVIRDNRQEFLVRTVVPEPSTYLMLATGLVLLVGFSRKRLAGRNEVA